MARTARMRQYTYGTRPSHRVRFQVQQCTWPHRFTTEHAGKKVIENTEAFELLCLFYRAVTNLSACLLASLPDCWVAGPLTLLVHSWSVWNPFLNETVGVVNAFVVLRLFFCQAACWTNLWETNMWRKTKRNEKNVEKSKKHVWHLLLLQKCFQGAQGSSPIIFCPSGLVAPGRFGAPPGIPQNRQNPAKVLKRWDQNLIIFGDAPGSLPRGFRTPKVTSKAWTLIKKHPEWRQLAPSKQTWISSREI